MAEQKEQKFFVLKKSADGEKIDPMTIAEIEKLDVAAALANGFSIDVFTTEEEAIEAMRKLSTGRVLRRFAVKKAKAKVQRDRNAFNAANPEIATKIAAMKALRGK